MPKVVEVPNIGNVEFPDSMSDDDVAKAIQAQLAAQPKPFTANAFEQAINTQPQGMTTGEQFAYGVGTGAIKGALSSALNIQDLIRSKMGQPAAMTPEEHAALTQPSITGQGTGKFLEQTGEFVVPDIAAGKVLAGAPVLVRMAGKGLTGAAVSGAQSGGDSTSMLVGGVLGGGGEALGTAASTINRLRNLPLAPTAENFRDAFAAVPTQMGHIQEAMPILAKYGIAPQKSVPEMKAAVDARLTSLGQEYVAKEAAGLGDKTMPAQQVLDQLNGLRNRYTTSSGNVPSANKEVVRLIDEQIADVRGDTDQAGNIKYRDLRTLRDAANRNTNWLNPDEDLYRAAGNAYRSGMDTIEPGMAQLNRDYQALSEASGIAQKNIDYGRGVLPSRFEQGIRKGTSPTTGAMLGEAAGGMLPIPGARLAGGLIGFAAYPKIVGPVFDALKNAAESGQLARMPAGTMVSLKRALAQGDTATVLRLLGQGTISTVQAHAAAGQ